MISELMYDILLEKVIKKAKKTEEVFILHINDFLVRFLLVPKVMNSKIINFGNIHLSIQYSFSKTKKYPLDKDNVGLRIQLYKLYSGLLGEIYYFQLSDKTETSKILKTMDLSKIRLENLIQKELIGMI